MILSNAATNTLTADDPKDVSDVGGNQDAYSDINKIKCQFANLRQLA